MNHRSQHHSWLVKRWLAITVILFFAVNGASNLGFSRASTGQIPSTIAADCSRDVTPEINAWIATIPNDSTIQFGANACYRIDGTLLLQKRSKLIIEGNNATIKAVTDGRELPPKDARTRAHMRITQSSSITVRNLIIRGANPNAGIGEAAYVVELEAQHGFDILGSQDIIIENSQVYDVYGDFAYIGNTTPSKRVTIRGNHFERNGRQGIAITNAEDVFIERNNISQTRRSIFDIEPNNTIATIRRVLVDNNDIGPARLNFFANHGAAAPTEDITFSNNRLRGQALKTSSKPPDGSFRHRIAFINNTSDSGIGNPAGGGMFFTRTIGLRVEGNTQPLQKGRDMALVKTYGGKDITVTGNTLVGGVQSLRADAATTNALACNNRLTATGPFNEPVVCTTASVSPAPVTPAPPVQAPASAAPKPPASPRASSPLAAPSAPTTTPQADPFPAHIPDEPDASKVNPAPEVQPTEVKDNEESLAASLANLVKPILVSELTKTASRFSGALIATIALGWLLALAWRKAVLHRHLKGFVNFQPTTVYGPTKNKH